MKRLIALLLVLTSLLSTLLLSACDKTDTPIDNTPQTTEAPDDESKDSNDTEATTAPTTPAICAHQWSSEKTESFSCGIKTTRSCTVCKTTDVRVAPVDSAEHNFGTKSNCSICGADKVTVNDVSLSKFTIVYADNAFSKEFATAIKNKITATKGYKLTTNPASNGENEYEIIVGNAGRDVASAFFAKDEAYLSQNYEIIVSGKKIAITVANKEMSDLAKERFFSYFFNDKDPLRITDSHSLKGDYIDTYGKMNESDIRITSFNILNENLSQKKNEFLKQIKGFNSDILCFQEYAAAAHDAYDSSLSDMGYTAVTSTSALWTHIFYRATRFELIDHGSQLDKNGNPVNNAPRTYLWALFKEKSSGKKFIVISVHFSDGTEDMRIANAKEMVAKIEELRNAHGKDIPIFLGGDMNTQAASTSYLVLTEVLTSVRSELPIKLKHNTSYGTRYELGKIPPKDKGYMIDHVLIGGEGVTVNQFQHVINLPLRSVSDHTPLITDIVLN